MNYPTIEQILSKKVLGTGFLALNAVLLLILLTHVYFPNPLFTYLMPGSFGEGIRSTGLWLFLALGFAANVLGVLLIGFAVIFPALLDGVGVDERRVARLLSANAAIPREALETCLAVVHAEAALARKRIATGRSIIILAAIALVFAFTAVCITLVHAPPRRPLFTEQSRTIENAAVNNDDIWRFTGDQIAGALALDIPELYDFRFGDLDNNVHAHIFTDFVFAFRALLGWVGLTSIIVTIRDWRSRPVRPAK